VGKTDPALGERLVLVGGSEVAGKGGRKMNTVQKYVYSCMSMQKCYPLKFQDGGEGMKESGGGGEFKCDIFDTF
jgi:hypothetical protein